MASGAVWGKTPILGVLPHIMGVIPNPQHICSIALSLLQNEFLRVFSDFIMVRVYKRKSQRGEYGEDTETGRFAPPMQLELKIDNALLYCNIA